jgi:hypothetical protein
MSRRITREERLTFYRMIIHQVYPESDYRILVNDGPIIRYLHEHPDMMRQFMRYTRSVRRTEGQTNNFYSRIYRMIQEYLLNVSSSQRHMLEDTEHPQ